MELMSSDQYGGTEAGGEIALGLNPCCAMCDLKENGIAIYRDPVFSAETQT